MPHKLVSVCFVRYRNINLLVIIMSLVLVFVFPLAAMFSRYPIPLADKIYFVKLVYQEKWSFCTQQKPNRE